MSSRNSSIDAAEAGRRGGLFAKVFVSCGCAVVLTAVATGAFAQVSAAKKTEAAALSTVAMQKAEAGDWKMAANMFQAAYAADPETHGYLYSAGRAEHKAGQYDLAERDYRAFIAKVAGDDPLRLKAMGYLEGVLASKKAAEAVREQAAPAAAATAKPVEAAAAPAAAAAAAGSAPVVATSAVAAPAAPDAWKGTAGWASLGVGAAALLGGATVFALAYSEGGDLDGTDYMAEPYADKKAAVDSYDSVRSRETIGAAVMGVGAVGVALGAWWLSSSPAATALLIAPDPARRGLIVGARF